jgi:hypothetical protein
VGEKLLGKVVVYVTDTSALKALGVAVGKLTPRK